MKKQRGSDAIRVVMIHQYDPTLETQVGGVEVFVNTFVKYAPEDIVARIFVVREDAAADYRSRFPAVASRIQFLPTWVDEDLFVSWPEAKRQSERRALAQQHGLDPERRWVLFIGRFEGAKDPLLLLD